MRPLALFVLALTGACVSPHMNVTPLGTHPYPPRPSDAPVALYQNTAPACAYDEVAIVHVSAKTLWQTDEKLADALRTKARELGGDAVIGVRAGQPVVGASRDADGSVSVDRTRDVSGTVIRFKDTPCAAARE